MHTLRGVPWAAILLVGALLLSACTGDEPEPTGSTSSSSPTSEPPSETATAEPIPTSTVPEMPQAATVGDAAGAEAFVRHWIELLNYAYATNDLGPVTAISDAQCDACSSIFSVIRRRASVDQRLEGGLIEVVSVRSPPPDDTGLVGVSVRFVQGDGTEIGSDGSSEAVEGSEPDNYGFALIFEEGAWTMAGAGSE